MKTENRGKTGAGKVATKGQQPPKKEEIPVPPVSVPDSGGKDPSRPIGRDNPPKGRPFPKGKSGNPKGYPKGQPNLSTVIKFWLNQTEEMAAPWLPGGKTLKVKFLDSMTVALVNKARKGDVAAYRELMDRVEGKPVQSTKLLNAKDQLLQFSVGFTPPPSVNKPAPAADKPKEEK